METYILTPSVFNEELNNKLNEGYVIKKIKIYFNKEIENIEHLFIKYSTTCIDYFKDSLEYFNNYISVNCCYINGEIDNFWKVQFFIVLNYFYVDYKYIEVVIIKPKYIVSHDSYYCNNINDIHLNIFDAFGINYEEHYYNVKYIIIRSNCFKTIDELIRYIEEISNISYEKSMKYILNSKSTYQYSIYDYYDKKNNNPLIEIFRGKIEN